MDWLNSPGGIEPADICIIKFCEIRDCEKHQGSCILRICTMAWCFMDDTIEKP